MLFVRSVHCLSFQPWRTETTRIYPQARDFQTTTRMNPSSIDWPRTKSKKEGKKFGKIHTPRTCSSWKLFFNPIDSKCPGYVWYHYMPFVFENLGTLPAYFRIGKGNCIIDGYYYNYKKLLRLFPSWDIPNRANKMEYQKMTAKTFESIKIKQGKCMQNCRHVSQSYVSVLPSSQGPSKELP